MLSKQPINSVRLKFAVRGAPFAEFPLDLNQNICFEESQAMFYFQNEVIKQITNPTEIFSLSTFVGPWHKQFIELCLGVACRSSSNLWLSGVRLPIHTV